MHMDRNSFIYSQTGWNSIIPLRARRVFTEDSSLHALPFKRTFSQFRLLSLERYHHSRTGQENFDHPLGNAECSLQRRLLDQSGTYVAKSRSVLLTMISWRAYCD